MATRLAETLLGAQSDMMRVHRRVVRSGAAAAWSLAAVLLVAGFLTGDDALFIESIGPILAAGFMTSLIVLHRENGGTALVGSAIVVIVMHILVPNPNTIVPAALGMVVICAIGMLFVTRNQTKAMAAAALLLGLVPFAWGLGFSQAVMLGLVMVVSFLMTALIFITLRNAATAVNTKFRVMFEQSPSAMFEEDWTAALAYVRGEYSGRPERIRQFLLAYPVVVRNAVAKAKITRANQAAVDLFEADNISDLLGSRDREKVTPENIESFVDALVALYEGRESFEQDFMTLTFKGRPVWLHARCVEVSSGPSPDSVFVAIADITHVKAREAAMKELIKSKDAFIASISHELRTPLTAVVGLTSEMMSPAMSDDERVELIGLVNSQAEEMSHIVDDLLVAARATMGTVQLDLDTVDLCEQLHAVLAGIGVRLSEIPGPLPEVTADAARVRQIIRNLLTNLSRYGGPVRRVVGGRTEEMTWIEFRDNGGGVAPGDEERIFQPYTTAHSGVTGSVGLGLSVARQLAELMGGSLDYRREDTESVFRLELPLASNLVGAKTV